MKKRSSYRPKPINHEAHLHLIHGFMPLRAATTAVQNLRITNHGALERVVSGKATAAEAKELLDVFLMACSLAEIGVGGDWLPEFEQAQQAVYALIMRGKTTGRYLFTGAELTAVNLGMEVHDLQIEASTIEVFEKAVLRSQGKRLKSSRFLPSSVT